MGMVAKDATFMSSDSNFDVQRTNHWNLLIEGMGVHITLAVDSVAAPKFNIEAIELSHGNTKVKVAGNVSVELGDIAFKDFVKKKVHKDLYDWFSIPHNFKTGERGSVEQYKKDGRLVLYSPDGQIKRSYYIEGMWMTDFNPGDYNYDTADKVLVTGTFVCDNAFLED